MENLYKKNANMIFDPLPSFDGVWVIEIDNLRRNALVENNVNLFDEFYNRIYLNKIKNIFQIDGEFDYEVDFISMPNDNNIGRCLKFYKAKFFANMYDLLNMGIDNFKLTSEQITARNTELLNCLELDNETINNVYGKAFKVKSDILKDVLEKEIVSEYFEIAMQDYNAYNSKSHNKIGFSEYIKNLYDNSLKLSLGFIKLGDFFETKIDYLELEKVFERDKFSLLFAKIIIDNLNAHENLKHYTYIYTYNLEINKVSNYNPSIIYRNNDYKKEIYTKNKFIQEYNLLVEKRSELKNYRLPEIDIEDNAAFKNITLIEKLNRLASNNTDISFVSSYGENFTDESFLQKQILDSSNYIGKIIHFKNELNDLYAYVYENELVIVHSFNKELLLPTYVINIDEFIKFVNSKMDILSYVRLIEGYLRRIFSSNINNWQRNLFDELNGKYSLTDAVNFIKDFRYSEIEREKFIYKNLLAMIELEQENFSILVDADNVLGLNVTSEEIINYLEFANNENTLDRQIIGNKIITEGNVLSILKIINDLRNYIGEYLLYINNDNCGTITYLVNCANKIYKTLGINVHINIDYSLNYNIYLNSEVTIIGTSEFILSSKKDFVNYQEIIG